MAEEIRYSNDWLTLLSVPLIEEITIKASARFIKGFEKDSAFYEARNVIKSVYFEDNSQLEYVPSYCFYQCSKLQYIELNKCKKLTEIKEYAFSPCVNLKQVEFPDTLESIGTRAFASSGITSIYLPKSFKQLGSCVCVYCSKLISFVIDENAPLTSLSDHTMQGTSITNFTITKNLASVQGTNFDSIGSLAKIYIAPGNNNFVVEDNVIFCKDKTKLIHSAASRYGSYTVPKGVEQILICGFHCSKLSRIILPDTLTSIGGYSFISSSITEIEFPSSCKSIGSSAFSSCSKLTKVVFNYGLESIGSGCFGSCSLLTNVTLPGSLKSLGGSAFLNCNKDLNLQFDPASNLRINDDLLITDKQNITLFQCASTSETITVPSSISSIGSKSFSNINTIKSITFEENSQLTTINQYAFNECKNLITISLPSTVEYIYPYSFNKCSSLENITFGTSLTLIDIYAFNECSSLKEVFFASSANLKKHILSGSSLVTINDYSFRYCEQLRTFDCKNRVLSYGKYSLYNCVSLKSIRISSETVSIGPSAFENCGLEECIFEAGNSIPTLEPFTFYNCAILKSIELPGTIDAIGSHSLSKTSIETIIIPASVIVLKASCFESCTHLTKVCIPVKSKLEEIEIDVFYDCYSFTTIENKCDNFVIENCALFDKNKTELIVLPPNSNVKYFSFPDTLKLINYGALQGCRNLYVIFIPYSVTEIRAKAFFNCINLRTINIPYTVATIGANAFKGCKYLECGISVDNMTIQYQQNLVNNAGLSTKSLLNCKNAFTCKCKRSSSLSQNLIYITLMIYS